MKPTEGRSVLWDSESGCDGTAIATPKHQRKDDGTDLKREVGCWDWDASVEQSSWKEEETERHKKLLESLCITLQGLR